MTSDLLVPAALAVVALALLVLLFVVTVALRRERARSRAELAATRAESTELRRRVDTLARQVEDRQTTTPTDGEFVITEVGREIAEDRAPAPRIEGRLFIDLVVRESVVKAAGLTHGVRRALAPETRNRIRFAMKQEVRRARKERRIELRDVRREMASRRAAERSPGNRPDTSREGAA